MRVPVKVKSELLPRALWKIVPNKPDPTALIAGNLDIAEFSRCISSICIDGVWRTTRVGRHPKTNQLLSERIGYDKVVSVLDVGVSDGASSVDLLDTLGDRIKNFFVTDLYTSIKCAQHRGRWYFFHPLKSSCIMVISKRFIYYPASASTTSLVSGLLKRMFDSAPPALVGQELTLMNPRVISRALADSRLRVGEWNVFVPWNGENVEVIRIANLLNPAYFTIEQLRAAINNCYRTLLDGGLFMIVDNRRTENATLLRKCGDRLTVIDRVGGGSDAESVFCSDWQPQGRV